MLLRRKKLSRMRTQGTKPMKSRVSERLLLFTVKILATAIRCQSLRWLKSPTEEFKSKDRAEKGLESVS
jgi:hypothetical protein